jgi:hypothetical protein
MLEDWTDKEKHGREPENEKGAEDKLLKGIFEQLGKEGRGGWLVQLTLTNGEKVELGLDDEFLMDGGIYKITKHRETKDGTFLLTIVDEENERLEEVTPERFEGRFKAGFIALPALLDKLEKEDDKKLEEIAELFKKEKIGQIVIHSREQKNKGDDLTFMQDPDTQLAIWILQNLSKKNFYAEGAKTTIIPKGGSEKDLTEKNLGGLRVFLDVSGNWPSISADGKEIYIDHHGEGQRKPTSTAEMVYKILKKADLLKEEPAWLPKYLEFVNSVDNLGYLNKRENGRKIFNAEYFRNQWPNSLYALMDDDDIKTNQFLDMCRNGTIKDPARPFTEEELNGEIGKTKIRGRGEEISIKDWCIKEKKEVEKTLQGIRYSEYYARQNKINLNTEQIGKIVYHNFPPKKITVEKKGGQKEITVVNFIQNDLVYKAIRALNVDTYISWNKGKGAFFLNSANANLSKIAQRLNEKYPGCADDVRGVMIHGRIPEGMSEQEFLNIIDPSILKNTPPGVISAEPYKKENGEATHTTHEATHEARPRGFEEEEKEVEKSVENARNSETETKETKFFTMKDIPTYMTGDADGFSTFQQQVDEGAKRVLYYYAKDNRDLFDGRSDNSDAEIIIRKEESSGKPIPEEDKKQLFHVLCLYLRDHHGLRGRSVTTIGIKIPKGIYPSLFMKKLAEEVYEAGRNIGALNFSPDCLKEKGWDEFHRRQAELKSFAKEQFLKYANEQMAEESNSVKIETEKSPAWTEEEEKSLEEISKRIEELKKLGNGGK